LKQLLWSRTIKNKENISRLSFFAFCFCCKPSIKVQGKKIFLDYLTEDQDSRWRKSREKKIKSSKIIFNWILWDQHSRQKIIGLNYYLKQLLMSRSIKNKERYQVFYFFTFVFAIIVKHLSSRKMKVQEKEKIPT